ncbi:hypothetical protein LSTR_LSTR002953 [Laodelphax striatellus]|uniref:Tudor domain-containing protein 1 n=1 Tax=Laodelphax striatellus TaxID=195883 RepID=A0A482XN18_LAOST|nr:hypothetical protein LSTR_LSTR002953 [Laodelphax striatellus]
MSKMNDVRIQYLLCQRKVMMQEMSIMELPEEFDPRLEAYKNPVAKTYSSGLGAKIQNSANGVSEGVTIQVSNVPKNMSEVELENLFSQCGNPKICKVRRTSHKLYMDVLVQYSKMSEVQSAIKRFNGQAPYNLKLSVVENKSQNRQELPVFNEPMAPATHDQIVRSTENFPAPNLPAFYDMYRALVTQPPTREFSLGPIAQISISLSDNRRVHGGRVHWTRPKNTKKVRKTSDRDNDHITALRFARSKKYQESGEEPMIPDKFSKRKCAVCGVLSNSCCNRCREVFYCCPGCQASHWADHKLVCGKTDGETAPERKNGLATTKSENFERNVNNMSSRENSSREQWTVEKAKANEVSKLEEAKPLEVDSGSQSQSRLIASLQGCVISPTSSSASTTSLPYFKEGEIYEVIVLYNPYCSLDRTEFFVTKRDKKEDLVELQLDLNCEISDSSQQLENIEVNSKCAAKYDGEWYRAQVQKLDPLTVLCIDFGNEEICKPADLKELPPRFRKGLYTVRIRLPGPASKEQLKAMNSSRPFKLRVAKKEGKYWLADFANDEQSNSNPEVAREKKPSKGAGSITRQEPESRPEPNSDLSLLPNEEDSRLDSYKKITDVARENARQKITAYCETRRVLSHKLFTCMTCTIDLDSAQDFVKQINDLDLGSPADKTYRPQINEMVAVYLENIVRVWARGIVLSEINGSYNVALVDHGIVVVSSNLKKLPDAYKKIPLLSVKLSLESSPPIRVKAGEIFQITLLKNLAYIIKWEIDVYLTSESPFHLGVGRLSSWKIEPDQVPTLATQKLDRLFGQRSICGELVAAKWDQDGNHYRAQILGKAIDKGCYKVLFVVDSAIDNIHTSKMKSIQTN